MSEILLRVIDKTNTDIYYDVQCTKRGDVIVAVLDGWPWRGEELTLPFWRIVKLPGVPLDETAAMLVPEPPVDPAAPSRTLQARAFKWDIDNSAFLTPAALGFLADDTRAVPMVVMTASVAAFRNIKVTKPPVPDPNVLTTISPSPTLVASLPTAIDPALIIDLVV